MSFSHIYVATRFFEKDPAKAPLRLAQLQAFVNRMLALEVGGVGIAINTAIDRSDAMSHIAALGRANVTAFAVTPWGRFVPALQALLQAASVAGFPKILCISVEVEIDADALAALDREVHTTALVAGLRMPGHLFQPGEHACDGPRSPWNTAALWRVRDGLDRIGFASAGEALFDPSGKSAGIEEVSTIALYQKMYGDCGATLLDASHVAWNTDRASQPDALEEKLRSKQSRAARQLASAQLLPGRVQHRVTRPHRLEEKHG